MGSLFTYPKYKNRIVAIVTATILFAFSTIPVTAQDTISFFQPADQYQIKRGRIAGYGIGGAYVLSMTGLYTLWYSDYPLGNFHTFNDNEEWLQVDKAGHLGSAYYLGKWSIDMMKWTGMEKKKAIWKGAAVSWAFQSTIEIFDGLSDQWGFSTGDMIANTTGTLLVMGQEWMWDEQRAKVKFSFHTTKYASYRPDQLGSTFTEKLFKDYNGQTYWLSVNIRSFLHKESKFPAWLNIAGGYGAEGMTGARENILIDSQLQPFERYRQFYIAPDIELSKIKTNNPILKTLFSAFGFIKFPAPAIEFGEGGKIKMHAIYF